MYPEYPRYNNNQNQDIIGKILADKKLLAIVVGGFFAFLTLIGLIIGSGGSPVPSRVMALSGHMTELSRYANDQQQETLISELLRDQNANTSILLAGASSDLQTVVTQVYGETKADKNAAAANAARLAEFQASIEQAVIANTVDETYRLQMIAELDQINAQLASYAAETKSSSLQTILIDVQERLTEARNRLEKLEL